MVVMAGVMRKSRRAGKPFDQPFGIRPPEFAPSGGNQRDRRRPGRAAQKPARRPVGVQTGAAHLRAPVLKPGAPAMFVDVIAPPKPPTWTAQIRTPAAHIVVICALQTLAGVEIAQHFEIESDGSFTINVIIIEAR